MKSLVFTAAVVCLALCLSSSFPTLAATKYVDCSVPVSGDGTSWETALKTIQEGIDVASDGDTVTVAEGVYVENIQFKGKNIALTSTDPLNPTVVANTIIDGNKAGSVVTFSGTESEACVLSGFTIQNGETSRYGGGIFGGESHPYSHATIENNAIRGNCANWGGGALAYCDGTIQNNTITGNSASGGGGLYGCNGTIQKSTIAGNSASAGGGLYMCNGTIQKSTIAGNSAGYGGGVFHSNGMIELNTITGNSATYEGGGLGACNGTIQNNAIAGNSARWGGGLANCGGTIQNNTITGNSASDRGGGLVGGHGTIRNCIIWGNTPISAQVYGSSILTYSCIQFWTGGGEGNIARDPQFVHAQAHDYRLQEGSPCIDAGVNADWMWTATDLDGNARILYGTVDIGADEHLLHWCVDASVSSSGDGTSWATALKTIQEGIDSSSHRDTIIVAEGTYVENIQFKGKNIVLTSADPLDSTLVANTIIDGNQAGSVVTFSGAETEACILSGFTIRNGSAWEGGGICGSHAHATIKNNIITLNAASDDGGGLIYCDGTIRGNIITSNSAGTGGGLYECQGLIERNTITGNSALLAGGLQDCDGTIRGNLISHNSGGGLHFCDGTIQNNTITGNSATYAGGGLDACNGAIHNCLIWGNIAPVEPQLYESSIPTYSCIQDWAGGGEGNITTDPQFVDPDGPDNDPATPEDNNYRLSAGSPCIDAGKKEDWMWTATDFDGNPRVFYGGLSLTVDMGAYEYGSWPFRITRVLMTDAGAFQLTWASRPGDDYVIWSSSDLTSGTWIQEQTVPSAGDSTSWTDPWPGGSHKFYRLEEMGLDSAHRSARLNGAWTFGSREVMTRRAIRILVSRKM